MNKKLVVSEIILLLASVFVFRSMWLLIDNHPIMHGTSALLISLVIGLAVAVFCINYIILQRKKQQ